MRFRRRLAERLYPLVFRDLEECSARSKVYAARAVIWHKAVEQLKEEVEEEIDRLGLASDASGIRGDR